MPQIILLAVTLAAAGGGGGAVSVVQDTVELRTAALASVMDFRRSWLGDSTPFEGCSAAEVTGNERELLATLPPHLAPMIVRIPSRACGVEAAPFDPNGENLASVRAIEVGDSLATVSLYVRVGMYKHHEVFTLYRQSPPGTPWVVRSLEITPGLVI